MPRVNPYRPHLEYGDQPTTSGAILFVGLVAAIILAAILWASYVSPENPNEVAPPANQQMNQPAAPSMPRNPATPAPAQ
jgi:hypothetical protein